MKLRTGRYVGRLTEIVSASVFLCVCSSLFLFFLFVCLFFVLKTKHQNF